MTFAWLFNAIRTCPQRLNTNGVLPLGDFFVYMTGMMFGLLMIVLKCELVTRQLIDSFDDIKSMKDYILEKQQLLRTEKLSTIAYPVDVHSVNIAEIRNNFKTVMDIISNESTNQKATAMASFYKAMGRSLEVIIQKGCRT